MAPGVPSLTIGFKQGQGVRIPELACLHANIGFRNLAKALCKALGMALCNALGIALCKALGMALCKALGMALCKALDGAS